VARVPHLTPETRAVLFCAQAAAGVRDPADVAAALHDCPSTPLLVDEVLRHGMLGHFCRVLGRLEDPAVPSSGEPHPEARTDALTERRACMAELSHLEGVRVRLEALHVQSAQRAITQAAQLFRLLDRFAAEGITALSVKGPVWAERLYGDVTLRHWVDLDVVVPFADAAVAAGLLLSEGFVSDSPYPWRVLQPTGQEGELQFRTRRNDASVDLHWQLGVGQSRGALSGETLVAHAVPVEILGRPVLTTSPADTFLLTCLHGTRHRWDSIELLLGLVVQIRRLAAEEWPALMEAAEEAGCRRRVTIAVAHACDVFDLSVPALVSDALESDGLARAFLATLTPERLAGEPAVGRREHFSSLLWTLAQEDSAAGNLGHLATRFFLPGPEDWEAYSLPQGLDTLYWVLRPARLLLKTVQMAPTPLAGAGARP
jgi:hypothetical protein